MIEKRGDFHFAPPPDIPGGTIVIPDTTWFECENCGEQLLSAELDCRLTEETTRRQGLLLPAQIKAIREKLGLTQSEMAERLRVGDKTYTRWESGRSMQNQSSDNLIRAMDRSPKELAMIEAQRDPERPRLIAGYFGCIRQPGQRGQNPLAMAAHDTELNLHNMDKACEALREAAKRQSGE
ncbi:MAG: type II toxin-antitoxin system MqsA family antitoxin [Phycisphaerae bacterium]|nr:type II toxin-antitoxin system MqsA family antitoxin [Phycisphaerae bacterium]